MAVWEKLYAELHGKRGLSAKPALLGISRGGLYVNAWVRLHPDRASVLYLDNGVCDIRSWPGGFQLTRQGKGSKDDWAKYKTEFGFADDETALEKSLRPTDQLLPAIQAGVLLLSCHGTADRTVPYEDNAGKLVEFWEQNKGRVKLFPKENGDHHPHGLPNPKPLIDLLVSEAEGNIGLSTDRAEELAPSEEILPGKWKPSIAPNPHPDAQWFRSAAFGIFQHWGIVSGSEHGEAWDMRVFMKRGDKEVPEADRLKRAISPEKMFARASSFNPTNYHPDRWMKAASTAGFRYAVLTTRHHDAYFLGDSKFGDWHAGHFIKRDLIAPWVEACRTNGIKVGFYFSGPDWYHGREYQDYNFPEVKQPPFYNWKHEKVDALPKMPEKLRAEIKDIAHGQILELLTKYGKVDLLWPDGGMAGFTVDESRKLQPGIIVGRGHEYASPEGWEMLKPEFINEANRRGYPWELCTIGHGGSWHWSEMAEARGSKAAALLMQLAGIRARGGCLLLNIAPRPDGEMPQWFYPLCDQLAGWMKTGAEAIYDINVTGPFPYPDQCAQPVTVKGNAWYVFANRPGEIKIKDVVKPSTVTLLRTGAPVPFEQNARQLTIRLAKEQCGELPEVIKVVWSKVEPEKTAQPAKNTQPATNTAPKKMDPAFEPITDDPKLPRVLIIGDSVSIAYTLAVRKELAGIANVHRPPANCGSTKIALGDRGMEHWLAGENAKWDIIHFNHGLHDLQYRFADDNDKNAKGELASPTNGGHQNVSPVEYEKNLRKIIARLKQTGAKLIFASTTPVPESDVAKYVKDSELPYNEVARKVMTEEGVAINDLWATVKPQQAKLQIPRNVHFHAVGSAALATQVAQSIRAALPKDKP